MSTLTRLGKIPVVTADVPCFAVSVEVQGRQYSVVESLRNLELDDRPSPSRPPTTAEMAPYMAGAPLSASGGVGFDPVCAVKALLKKIGGRSRAFYLYRVRDEAGERFDPGQPGADVGVRKHRRIADHNSH